MASGLTFKSFKSFEFIAAYGVNKKSNLALLHTAIQFAQHHILKRLSIFCGIFLYSLS